MRQQARGFTLIEVLVALSIVSVALLAGLKATGALSHNAQRQDQTLLAQVCADNALIDLRLRRQLPAMGNTARECLQAQQAFTVHLAVTPTPNPNFRRVDAKVLLGEVSVMQISTIVGNN